MVKTDVVFYHNRLLYILIQLDIPATVKGGRAIMFIFAENIYYQNELDLQKYNSLLYTDCVCSLYFD